MNENSRIKKNEKTEKTEMSSDLIRIYYFINAYKYVPSHSSFDEYTLMTSLSVLSPSITMISCSLNSPLIALRICSTSSYVSLLAVDGSVMVAAATAAREADDDVDGVRIDSAEGRSIPIVSGCKFRIDGNGNADSAVSFTPPSTFPLHNSS